MGKPWECHRVRHWHEIIVSISLGPFSRIASVILRAMAIGAISWAGREIISAERRRRKKSIRSRYAASRAFNNMGVKKR